VESKGKERLESKGMVKAKHAKISGKNAFLQPIGDWMGDFP